MLPPRASEREAPPVIGDRVELQLLTTLKCNLRCTYCSLREGNVLRSQKHASYTAGQLEAFVRRHLADKEVYFTFYGGEPTLNPGFILDVMERFPGHRFNLQTNGTLLDRVPDRILSRLSNIMISVDGGQAVTDGYRGEGVYRKALDNAARVRARTRSNLTARVTWWSGDTTFEDIDSLATRFDYVYFQFAQDEGAHPAESVTRKKKVLGRLIERFFAADGLYPVVPIMGTVRNKVAPWRIDELCSGLTQCRVSGNLLNVMPDGRIFPCPDMLYAKELLQGDVAGNWLTRSPLQPHPDMPCRQCPAYQYCRGNCMKNLHLAYVRKNHKWRTLVTDPICELIRFIGSEVDRRDAHAWFSASPREVRDRLLNAEVYEFCEVMP